jgi:4-hydroxythreonine-4-phosphate dehydrogenase
VTGRLAPQAPLAVTPLAVTMGDPAGIGPDILLSAWAQSRSLLPPLVAFADPDVLRARAVQCGFDVAMQEIAEPSQWRDVGAALAVVPVRVATTVRAGKPDAANATAVIASIDQAVMAIKSGAASAIVTNPIAKHVLYAAGFKHPGHTEYLGALAGRHWPGQPKNPVMMLAGPDLRVVPLTVHVPLAAVPGLINEALILETAQITIAALKREFGIAVPRLAVAGLNPHAGEGGNIGVEDERIVRPAVARLCAMGFDVTGPHSADTLFHVAARQTYDAVLCMYHDQALIPLKTLAFDDGVNITLGLPFVRTSPDHGTAFDIAGSGHARAVSLIAALRLAAQLATKTGAAT